MKLKKTMNSEQMIPERYKIAKNDKWNLSPLFQSDEEWEILFKELESSMKNIASYKGRLVESIEIFKEVIELDLSISRKLDKLYTYAHLKNDEDKTNQKYSAIFQKAMNLHTRITEITSYIAPELQSIPDKIMKEYLSNQIIEEYLFYLEKILRRKPHTLTEDNEEILARAGEMANAPYLFFSMLDNADLRFGAIEDENGNVVELSHGNFNSFLISQNRDIRKKAFFQYYDVYENHKQCLAASLTCSMKKDLFYAVIKKYKNCKKASLFADNIPDKVYDNLINTVKKNLGNLFKYLRYRKTALDLPELHFYDANVPLVSEINFNMPYEEATNVCIEALSPLGKEYTDILREGLTGSWVDKYENRGKRSGAYSSGCFDSPPYILLNYTNGNINSLYTLIHEAGHSMHSYYSRENQSYVYHNYSIFVAEVASTFNEILLSNYLLNYYDNDPKMKTYIINREIDNIRATLFRQTMFAEFEKSAHTVIENNEPLTLEVITNIYRGLLEDYFSHAMIIDEALTLECLRIPHFYSPFYVYKYATGISASLALADKVIKGNQKAISHYLEFLKMGGSKFPIDELKHAGVNMEKPQAIENAIHYFENLVDSFIKIHKDI